jgi:hypothetical protein
LNLFLVLVAAHVCGDVLTYSAFLAIAKRSGNRSSRAKALALHCFVHAFFVLILGWLFGIKETVVAVGYIFVVHFMIDFVRVQVEPHIFNSTDLVIVNKSQLINYVLGRKDDQSRLDRFMGKYFWKWLMLNASDQSLHLASIVIFVWVAGGKFKIVSMIITG